MHMPRTYSGPSTAADGRDGRAAEITESTAMVVESPELAQMLSQQEQFHIDRQRQEKSAAANELADKD